MKASALTEKDFRSSFQLKVDPETHLKHQTNLSICSLNLGHHVLSNQAQGSEEIQVRICQSVYPKYAGWADVNKSLSQCSLNAAHLLLDYDIIGLQEVNPAYQEEFFRQLPQFTFYVNQNVAIGVKDKILGPGEQLTASGFTFGPVGNQRNFQIVWFYASKLLLINLHAGHNINLKEAIENACLEVNLSQLPIKRIIMTGDFNDGFGQLLFSSLDVAGHKLYLPGYDSHSKTSFAVKTCCADVNYAYIGDYIFDSQIHIANTIHFGLPPSYNRNYPPISDHDPIVLISLH